MKRHLVAAAVLTLGFLTCFLCGVSLAQDQEEEELEYSWGTVRSLFSNKLVVTEYDYDSDEDVDVTYTVDPKVELENVELLKDIKAGDSVIIDHVVRGGKKVAKIITVEKPSYEEKYTPLETYKEEPEYSPEEIY